ncbi:hypothetical protein V8F33_013146 [Rhypophila sp. PSN 637]
MSHRSATKYQRVGSDTSWIIKRGQTCQYCSRSSVYGVLTCTVEEVQNETHYASLMVCILVLSAPYSQLTSLPQYAASFLTSFSMTIVSKKTAANTYLPSRRDTVTMLIDIFLSLLVALIVLPFVPNQQTRIGPRLVAAARKPGAIGSITEYEEQDWHRTCAPCYGNAGLWSSHLLHLGCSKGGSTNYKDFTTYTEVDLDLCLTNLNAEINNRDDNDKAHYGHHKKYVSPLALPRACPVLCEREHC